MQEESESPRLLLRAAGKLKEIQRAGWVKKAKIRNPESVADHSFRMAVLGAYLSLELDLDSAKVMRMCLLHDIAESEIGDLMPEEKSSAEEHRSKEFEIFKTIVANLPKKSRRTFLEDWRELLEMETRESKLVWEIDKLEMGLTMKDYTKLHKENTELKDFDPSKVISSELRSILDEY